MSLWSIFCFTGTIPKPSIDQFHSQKRLYFRHMQIQKRDPIFVTFSISTNQCAILFDLIRIKEEKVVV